VEKTKNILLLVDNASSHQLAESEIEELSNIKLHFLPPNTTSYLQPIDQGIQSNYTRTLLSHVLVKKTYIYFFIL